MEMEMNPSEIHDPLINARVKNPANTLDASLGVLVMPPPAPDVPSGPHLMMGK